MDYEYIQNTILIAMYGQGKTRGQSAYLQIPASITQNCGAIVVDEGKAVPKYVWYYLMSIYDKSEDKTTLAVVYPI